MMSKHFVRVLSSLGACFALAAFPGVAGATPSLVAAVPIGVESCPGTISGALTLSSPTQIGRVTRDGVSSSCTVAKLPSLFTSVGFRYYNIHEFRNDTAAPTCATLTLHPTSVGANIEHVPYTHGAFNPNSVATGAIGDPGLSTLYGSETDLALDVTIPAASSIDLVVFAVNPSDTATYTLTAASCGTGSPIAMAPSVASTMPYGTVKFNVTGSAGSSFVWTMQSNPSGGWVDSSGEYHAGPTPNTQDVVRVADGNGNSATAIVDVGVWDALKLTPASSSVSPRASKLFQAFGGAPPYQFSFVGNSSLGSLSASGSYVAGRKGSVMDVVRVTDSAGTSMTASISVGPGMAVTPAKATVAPRALVEFQASGGNGTDPIWSIVKNGSGGSIDPVTGTYRAGTSSHSVDVVRAQDTLGNLAEVSVSVGGGMGLAPMTASTSPRGMVSFEAFGGTNAFTWSLKSSPSGGKIDSATGLYQAGSTGGVQDTVYAVDSAGNWASAVVDVDAEVSASPANASVGPSELPAESSGSASGVDVGSSDPGLNIGGSDASGCASARSTHSAGWSASVASLLLGLVLGLRRRRR